MNVSENLTFPDGLECPDNGDLEVFRKQIWENTEVCNGCFQRIRSVGPKVERQLGESGDRRLRDGPPLTLEVNEWHERTEQATQEWTPWDHNSRYGTCFCVDCGSDGAARDDTLSVNELTRCGRRIVRYLCQHTAYHADSETFGRVLGKLCRIDENAGYDTEKLAVATVYATSRQSPTVSVSAVGD